MNRFQDRYIEESIDAQDVPQTLYIAEINQIPVGFIHVLEITEEISQEKCANVTLQVYVLSVDRENERIALSMKRLIKDPWSQVGTKYAVGVVVEGEVTNLTDFGA